MPKSTVTPIRGRPAALGTSALELKQMADEASLRTMEASCIVRVVQDSLGHEQHDATNFEHELVHVMEVVHRLLMEAHDKAESVAYKLRGEAS